MNKYLSLEIMTKGRFLIFLISDLIENYTYNKIVFSINIVSNYGIIFYFCYIELIISLYLKYKYKMIIGEFILNFVHNITKNISSSIYILKFKKKNKRDKIFKRCNVAHFLFTSSIHSFHDFNHLSSHAPPSIDLFSNQWLGSTQKEQDPGRVANTSDRSRNWFHGCAVRNDPWPFVVH